MGKQLVWNCLRASASNQSPGFGWMFRLMVKSSRICILRKASRNKNFSFSFSNFLRYSNFTLHLKYVVIRERLFPEARCILRQITQSQNSWCETISFTSTLISIDTKKKRKQKWNVGWKCETAIRSKAVRLEIRFICYEYKCSTY